MKPQQTQWIRRFAIMGTNKQNKTKQNKAKQNTTQNNKAKQNTTTKKNTPEHNITKQQKKVPADETPADIADQKICHKQLLYLLY